MRAVPSPLPGVVVIEPKVFGDSRGFFFESFNQRDFCHHLGLDVVFVQDNHSRSGRGVLRGLHYQICQPQGKLVRVVGGAVFDVAVDIRRSSPNYGRWFGVQLTEDNHRQVWIPPGFAHGFYVLSDTADFLYKTTDYYNPGFERSLLWNDPAIGISWPIEIGGPPVVSEKDSRAVCLNAADVFE